MQTSRVNGLTSGVFILVPASCLNQKGSNTRRDNTTFPVADYYPILPVLLQNAGSGENLLSRFRGTTEHCERVSYDVPVIADQPLLYS